jgi:hypothetical protein
MDCIFDTGHDMIEVLKQALDALETEVSIDWTNNDEFNASAEKMHDAIASLQQAIKELESQEPVGEVDAIGLNETDFHVSFKRPMPLGTKLYTAPPQRTWVGLTKEDKDLIEDLCDMMIGDAAFSTTDAILKGKNT